MIDVEIKIYKHDMISFPEMVEIVAYLMSSEKVTEEWLTYEEINN